MSYRTLPASRPAYSYDPLTRELLGTITVFLSPSDGTYSLPPYVVEFSPGEPAGQFRRHRLTDALDAWEIVADYRYVMLWDKASALPVSNRMSVGEVPGIDVTVLAPLQVDAQTPARNLWNEAAACWELVPDYSQRPLWEKATARPAAPITAGENLPHTLTTTPPPRDDAGPWRFDDASGAWVRAEVVSVEP